MRFNSINVNRHHINGARNFVPSTLIFVVLFPVVCLSQPQLVESNSNTDACRLVPEHSTRLQCYERQGAPGNPTKTGAMLANGWQLTRTLTPKTGVDAISISHAADFEKSDPNFAGIVVRCAEGQIEVLMAVIEPYPPLITIDVMIKRGKGPELTYRSSVVPPGVMIRLPSEAATSITDDRQRTDELSVTLINGTAPRIAGIVKFAGFEQAIGTLKSLCRTP